MKHRAPPGAVDALSPLRARVAKVKQNKRARAAARRRLALARAAAAAEAADAARTAAIRTWDSEERRLAAAAADRRRTPTRVRFAPNCQVTAIPAEHQHTLPAAIVSPARLEDGPRVDPEEEEAAAAAAAAAVPSGPQAFSEMQFDDSDDDDYEPVALVAESDRVPDCGKRRRNPPRRARIAAESTSPSTPEAELATFFSILQRAESNKKRRTNGSEKAEEVAKTANGETNTIDAVVVGRQLQLTEEAESETKAAKAEVNAGESETKMAKKMKARADENGTKMAKAKARADESETKTAKKTKPSADGSETKMSKTKANGDGNETKVMKKTKVNGDESGPKLTKDCKANADAPTETSSKQEKRNSRKRSAPSSSNGDANGLDELEAIFSGLANKKARTAKQTGSSEKASNVERKGGKGAPSDSASGRKGSASSEGSPARQRRYTEEGYPIYTEEELASGNGNLRLDGDCPFDCSCCT